MVAAPAAGLVLGRHFLRMPVSVPVAASTRVAIFVLLAVGVRVTASMRLADGVPVTVDMFVTIDWRGLLCVTAAVRRSMGVAVRVRHLLASSMAGHAGVVATKRRIGQMIVTATIYRLVLCLGFAFSLGLDRGFRLGLTGMVSQMSGRLGVAIRRRVGMAGRRGRSGRHRRRGGQGQSSCDKRGGERGHES
jgi:hypothetical protein